MATRYESDWSRMTIDEGKEQVALRRDWLSQLALAEEGSLPVASVIHLLISIQTSRLEAELREIGDLG